MTKEQIIEIIAEEIGCPNFNNKKCDGEVCYCANAAEKIERELSEKGPEK